VGFPTNSQRSSQQQAFMDFKNLKLFLVVIVVVTFGGIGEFHIDFQGAASPFPTDFHNR
jgi:hypothetical protein